MRKRPRQSEARFPHVHPLLAGLRRREKGRGWAAPEGSLDPTVGWGTRCARVGCTARYPSQKIGISRARDSRGAVP